MKTPYKNLQGTLFIVTYGRSGSTIVQSLLQSIPHAHITGENNNALDHLFRSSQSIQNARKIWGKKNQPATHPWYGADKLRPVRFEKRLTLVFTEEVIQPPKDVRWMGFKEIRYPKIGKDLPKFIRFCHRNFHNAHFVFNSRKAEDVAKSKWWANKPKSQVLNMVSEMDASFAKFTKANPAFAHHVFYEDIVADPAALQPLFDALKEPLDLQKARAILKRKLTH
jgi:hypothetical protein